MHQEMYRKHEPFIVRFVRRWPEVRFVRRWPDVRAKLARRSCEVGPKFVRSWPEVRAKLARSSCEVGPKFVRSWPEVRAKWARSSHKVLQRSSLRNVNILFAPTVYIYIYNIYLSMYMYIYVNRPACSAVSRWLAASCMCRPCATGWRTCMHLLHGSTMIMHAIHFCTGLPWPIMP